MHVCKRLEVEYKQKKQNQVEYKLTNNNLFLIITYKIIKITKKKRIPEIVIVACFDVDNNNALLFKSITSNKAYCNSN